MLEESDAARYNTGKRKRRLARRATMVGKPIKKKAPKKRKRK